MGDKSKIEWTDASWTPIRASSQDGDGWHCEHVSEGCRNCYSERMNLRLGSGLAFKPGNLSIVDLFLDERILLQPLRWKKPRRIFVCSMTDIFADFVKDEWIDRIFAIMALCPQHTFQVLTKRSARMRAYISEVHETWCKRGPPAPGSERIYEAALAITGAEWLPETPAEWPIKNCWLGVSAEDQKNANARIPDLRATPAAVRFVSIEPMLGPIDLDSTLGGTLWIGGQRGCDGMHRGIGTPECPRQLHHHHDERCKRGLDWVICGGESGPNARPMHPDWARAIRDQCAAAGVPFFFKQWGEWETSLDRDHDDPDWRADYTYDYVNHGKSKWLNRDGGCGFHGDRFHVMRRVGKRAASRLLDGREHNEFPGASQ
ncbi:DUF5131 family protein [Methylocella tundrae]|uniref:Phage Gp37/Gp68 family protein n=1 Tax=Methylocella tundrae TaxID=227605 RepID=A0A4U8YY07_METTU|nr:phage Gp37/Gp68 family protein [Methylocella tundrae]WPP05462.1 phage Gp37/Gp68 family protein [Methylocella tundrae]VFU07882.1 conserved protein of unknown function [Methylocella tundrae]